MVKVQNPFLTSYCSGRLANAVYQPARGHTLVKPFYPPIQKRRPSQYTLRHYIFEAIAYQYTNLDSGVLDRWIDHTQKYYTGYPVQSNRNLTSQQVFFKYNIPLRERDIYFLLNPPLTPNCSYITRFNVYFSGYQFYLSWVDAIPTNCAIYVSQRRNLYAGNKRGKKTSLSHIFTPGTASPQAITPPCGTYGGPGDHPAYHCGTWIHFNVWLNDQYGRSSPHVFFNVRAS